MVIPAPESGATALATTLKMPDELKRRVRAAARAAAVSPHAWMLRALETQARLDEQRREFLDAALAARAEAEAEGKLYAAADVHRYLLERARGRRAARPAPAAWRK